MRGRARITGAAVAAAVLVVVAVVVGASLGWFGAPGPAATSGTSVPTSPPPASPAGGLQALFDAHRSDVEVRGSGTVVRLLPDDDEGSRHQRFVLALPDGLTVLVAHNIDIAPRLDGLRVGDEVGFVGEYVWSAQGGTVHWTHRDPAGRHPDGRLTWRGRSYD